MNNGAAQTAQAQQSNQLQAEQFLAQQQQKAEQQWAQFFQNNPSPASTWSGIAAPNFGNSPAHIGGGSFGGAGGTLSGAYGGWNPTGPHGTPTFAAPPPQRDPDPGKKKPPGDSSPPPPPGGPGHQPGQGSGPKGQQPQSRKG